jgi:hypothetical protein
VSNILGNGTPNTPLFDAQGNLTLAWRNWFRSVTAAVGEGFDPQGNYQGPIGTHATIAGRETLATIVQHLLDSGIIEPAGLPAATDAEQGAVILPAGATSNTLGSAATHAAGDFDPTGSAAAAQTAASAHADTVAATAQTNAESFATTSIAAAFAPGITIVITTFGPTTNGSQTFTNGLLTAQVQAT